MANLDYTALMTPEQLIDRYCDYNQVEASPFEIVSALEAGGYAIVPKEAGGNMINRFEHKTLTLEPYQVVHQQPLNEMSKEGWELIAVTNIPRESTPLIIFHLKRQIEYGA